VDAHSSVCCFSCVF